MRSPEDLKVKVCGVARMDDALLAYESGADIVGVVMDRSVIRHGTPELVTRIHEEGIPIAAVYTSLEAVLSGYGNEDYIQLHFPHGPEVVREAREKTGRMIISVIQFTETARPVETALAHYSAGADIVLLEDRNGAASDLERIGEIQKTARTAVSGRIKPGQAASIARIKPLMIDLSSSLEEYPGRKDPALIRELFSSLEVV